MPRKITVTFEDGSQHVYNNAPDDVTPEQVTARAEQEFGLGVTSLDGGRSGAAPVPPAPVENASSPAPKVGNNIVTDRKLGIDRIGENYDNYEIQPFEMADEQRFSQMYDDPNVTYEELNAFAKQRGGFVPLETFNKRREEIKAGTTKPGGDIVYKRMGSELMDNYSPMVDPTIDSDVTAGLERGMANNPMGVVTRVLSDLFDSETLGYSKDQLRQLYPDLDDDQIETIHDNLIGEARRRELINANYQYDQREVNPALGFATDVVGGASPLDIIGPASGARLGTKLAVSGGVNFLADGVLQGSDIAYGAQQKYDPAQGAMAAASGVAFEGLGELVAAGGRRLFKGETHEAAPAPTSSISVPTSRTNTKKYKAELVTAQEQVIDRVNNVAEGWTNPPKFEVHPNFKEVAGVPDSKIGVYRQDGKVLLNTEAILERAKTHNVTPEAVVDSVVFHEALGHYGMTQRWGDELDNVMETIYDNANPLLREKIDQWIERNPDAYKYSPNNAKAEDPRWQRIRATEEIMAEVSEKEGLIPQRLYDKIANKIKNFARDMGLNLKISEREVRAYLATAQRRVTEGEPTGFTPNANKNSDEGGDPFYAGTEDTTSAGFKRFKPNDRSAAEARKQFWKNKQNPDWNPNDPNGLPTNDKYMSGDGPIDPDVLTGEDLANAKDALEILERINYVPTAVSQADLEMAMQARGLYPSDIVRLSSVKPGDLQKKQFLYDTAAQKLSERMAALKEDMRVNGITEKNQLEYMKATLALDEVTTKLFNLQSEFGRGLNAAKRANFTRAKIKNLKELLKAYGAEDLEAVMADPESFNKFMAEVEAQLNARTGKTGGKAEAVYSVLNLPRAVMSSMDLSAPLRQGVVFIGNKNYWKAFGSMFTFLGPNGRARYGYLMRQIARHENYPLMKEAKLGFSDIDGTGLTGREEDFQTDLINKFPKVFAFVRQSEQAYAGFLNKLRADMFNKYIEQFKKAGVDINDPELLKGLGTFINSATGRADLPKGLASSAPLLNAVFFSPRLMVSRFNMIANPVFYAKLPAPVRKEAAKQMLAFGSIAATTLGAFATFGDDDTSVEWDSRSSDFGKIRVGDTRFDIGGGFNQYITLGARGLNWMAGNEAYKTSTGDLQKLGKEEGQTSFGEVVWRFFRSKLSPNASFVVDAINEENVVGEPFTVGGSVMSRLIPLHLQAVAEAYKEDNPGLTGAVAAAGLFGVGTSTYTPKSVDKEQEIDAPAKVTYEGETYELTEEEQQFFKETRNNYFRTFVAEYTVETGKKWEDLSEDEQKNIINRAKKDAQYFSREDMLDEVVE